MAPVRKPGRPAARWFGGALLAALVLATPAPAQEATAEPPSVATPVLTLDQERFFVESAFGRAALARESEALRLLEEENKRIEAELIAEEQSLTELRRTLPPAEFTARATAFDQKVERIRDEQDAKAAALTAGREGERQQFLKAAIPVLGDLLSEKQAVAILDKSTIILSLSAIEITDEAIARVDAVLPSATPAAP